MVDLLICVMNSRTATDPVMQRLKLAIAFQAGMAAREYRVNSLENPYPDGSQEKYHWYEGWLSHDAAKKAQWVTIQNFGLIGVNDVL